MCLEFGGSTQPAAASEHVQDACPFESVRVDTGSEAEFHGITFMEVDYHHICTTTVTHVRPQFDHSGVNTI